MVKKKEENSSESEKKIKEVKEVKAVNLESEKIDIDLSEVKDDLTDYMKNKIDKEVEKAIEKSSKKLIRYKNSIILKKNITIIILLIICAFLAYNLYKISNINIDISTTKKNEQKVEQKEQPKEETKENEIEKKKKEFENKKKEYKQLIDDIYISEDSTYIKDFYEGNLTDEIKLFLALNKINEEKVVSEEDSIYIEENDIKEGYDNFFESDFTPKSFEYNNLKFHYLASKSMFISNGKFEKAKSNIVKEIIDIDESKDIIITTVEGIIKDDKLYNIVSKKEVKNYKKDNLENYKDELTTLHYHLEKDNDNYNLVEISK